MPTHSFFETLIISELSIHYGHGRQFVACHTDLIRLFGANPPPSSPESEAIARDPPEPRLRDKRAQTQPETLALVRCHVPGRT